MKFFKSVRTWIATALCALMCVTGGVAVNELTSKKAIAAETTVVSDDIQMVVDAFNKSIKGLYQSKAEYVEDYPLANVPGKTVSGIKLTFDAAGSDSEGQLFYSLRRLNLNLNISHLTATDSLFGMIVNPDGVTHNGAPALPNFDIGLKGVNTQQGVMFRVYNDSDYDDIDKAGTPKGGFYAYVLNSEDNWSMDQHITSGDEKSDQANLGGNRTLGVYYPESAANGFAVRGASTSSPYGYQTKPFNVYYDYATNVIYKDVSGYDGPADSASGLNKNATKSLHQSDKYRFIQFLNVNPANRTKVDFDYRYCGTYGGAQMPMLNYSGSKTFYAMPGFENGKADVVFSCHVTRKVTGSVILTSFLGLDLTNPQNTFTDGVLVNDSRYAVAGDTAIPAPKFETAIGNEIEGNFEGTVNVYSGARTYNYAYGSYGASVISAEEDTGLTVVQKGLSVGSTIQTVAGDKYILEYVSTDGQVAYATLETFDGTPVTLDSANTTVYKNGELLNDGDTVAPGDVLKFVANDGYELFNFSSSDALGSAALDKVVVNSTLTTLTSTDEYVVTEEVFGSGAISITSAAFSNKYIITLGRLGGSATDTPLSLFEGIDCKYYNVYDPTRWQLNKFTIGGKSAAGYYGVFHYNGKKVYLNQKEVLKVKDYTHPTNHELGGFTLKNSDTGEYLGLLKLGMNDSNAFPVHCNVNVVPFTRESKVLPSVIKTEGTVGLTVQFLINKTAYDLMTEAYVDYDGNNGLGYPGTSEQAIYAMVIPERHIEDFNNVFAPENEGDKYTDPYRYYTYATNASYQEELTGKWQQVEVTNFGEDVVIDGTTYVSFNVTIRNIKLDSYNKGFYIGAYMNTGTCNGGDVYRFGMLSKVSFQCYNVLETAQASYANISTEDSQKDFVYNINGENYYTDVYTEDQTKTLVKFYNYGMYLSYISTEAIEGYGECNYDEENGIVYYYDTGKINSETDAKRIIKYALEMIG